MIPSSTFSQLPSPGNEARLRITTVVREDDISLYGFASEPEQWLFTLLQGVSGVGPKLALKILSGIQPERLRDALSTEDTALLCTIPGVGKKMAQRLVVELRDKAGSIVGLAPAGAGKGAPAPAAQEAAEALIGLGYPIKTARDAIDAALTGPEQAVEELIRDALKHLAAKSPKKR
jgi:Holliday junction DNA helicase RuvA